MNVTEIVSPQEGEHIVSMIELNGAIYVATQKNIYKLEDEARLEPLKMMFPDRKI